jgi:hypothetical protein
MDEVAIVNAINKSKCFIEASLSILRCSRCCAYNNNELKVKINFMQIL